MIHRKLWIMETTRSVLHMKQGPSTIYSTFWTVLFFSLTIHSNFDLLYLDNKNTYIIRPAISCELMQAEELRTQKVHKSKYSKLHQKNYQLHNKKNFQNILFQPIILCHPLIGSYMPVNYKLTFCSTLDCRH